MKDRLKLKRPKPKIWFVVGAWVLWLGFLAVAFRSAGRIYQLKALLVFSGVDAWWGRLANFDGYHYWNLVKDGYVYGLYQSFFPGFALLMRPFYWLVGNYVVLAGVLINLALLFASLVLLKEISKGNKVQAGMAVLFLLSWPASFYFASFYTESLFLVLSLAAFYFYTKNKTGPALLMAGAASAVRLAGIFIVVSFILDRLVRLYRFKGWRGVIKGEVMVKMFLWLVIGGVGLWLYMAFLQIRFGDALIFFHNQSRFLAGRQTDKLILLPQVIYRYLKMFITTPINNPIFFVISLEFWSLVLAIAGLVFLWLKKAPVYLQIYGWLSLILPTLTGTLSSLPRYVLVIFPVFLGLSFLPKRVRWFVIGVNAVWLFFAFARFIQGWWIA
ncbi:MAG: hypothetical protein GXP43_01810 [bacterium]|nr:hypothetical protein [bacterium]